MDSSQVLISAEFKKSLYKWISWIKRNINVVCQKFAKGRVGKAVHATRSDDFQKILSTFLANNNELQMRKMTEEGYEEGVIKNKLNK